MSYNGDETHCVNLDCIGQLEIGQADYLLNHPRKHENINQIELQIFKKD